MSVDQWVLLASADLTNAKTEESLSLIIETLCLYESLLC